MSNMVDIQRSYAYLPKAIVGDMQTSEPRSADLNQFGKFPFTDFATLGDTSRVKIDSSNLDSSVAQVTPKIFDVKKVEGGTLFVSRKSHVVDLLGREVPRALLVTEMGSRLLRDFPGILKSIDNGDFAERLPKTRNYGEKSDYSGWSGKVTIIDLPNGESIAIKRFKRLNMAKDMISRVTLPDGSIRFLKKYNRNNPARGVYGRRMPVGGLEVAKFKFALEKSEMRSKVRNPEIYFASQDILVMENTEQLMPAMEACDMKPSIFPTVRSTMTRLEMMAHRLLEEISIFGEIEGRLPQHLYIEGLPLEPDKLKFVWLDPLN